MNPKKKFSIWTVISAAAWILMLAAECFFFIKIDTVGLLPPKMFAVAIICLLVVCGTAAALMFVRTTKSGKRSMAIRRILAYIMAVFVMIGSVIGGMALSKLDETINKVTQTQEIQAHIGVYVLKDDAAKSLSDAAKYIFGVANSYDPEHTGVAIQEMEKSLKSSLTVTHYDTVFPMITDLYHKRIGALVLNTTYIDVLEEAPGYTDFLDRTRLIFECTVKIQSAAEDPTQSNSENKPHPSGNNQSNPAYRPANPKDPFIVYLSGSDTRNKKLARSRSDVNILAVVNPTTHQILLINTPRDSFIPNPAGNGALDKLTHCGLYGVPCSVKALSDFYKQPISWYGQINFTGFETLVDAVGGINIYSEKGDGVMLQKGDNHMDGKTALRFARERYSYAGGDNTRGRHQMQVIGAIVDKLTSGAIITNYFDILDSLQGMFATDMPRERISDLIKMQLDDMKPWTVLSYAITGKGGKDIPYSMPGLRAYVMYPDMKTVDRASHLMQRVLAGESLTTVDVA